MQETAYAPDYWDGRRLITHEVLHEVEEARRHLRGKTLLDVGSGTGRHAHLLGWYGFEVTTTDLLPTGAPRHLAGDFLQLDIRGQWDTVTAFHLLEHLSSGDLPRALGKLASLAKERVVLVVPHPRRLDYHDDPTHRDLPIETLRAAVQAQFPRVTEHAYDNVATPPPWSPRALPMLLRKLVRRAAWRNVMWVADAR